MTTKDQRQQAVQCYLGPDGVVTQGLQSWIDTGEWAPTESPTNGIPEAFVERLAKGLEAAQEQGEQASRGTWKEMHGRLCRLVYAFGEDPGLRETVNEMISELQVLMRAPARPSYFEVVQALEEALEHLDYCGWGDAWERDCSEKLRESLPKILEQAKGGGPT